MPHGGGHAGGGHHGGGGGFHHHHGGGYHHHHRHLHHHGGGWGWGWGWGYGGYGRGYRGWGYSGVGITIFFVVVIVIAVLSVRYTGSQVGDNDSYSPGATIIVSYAPTLCDGLDLSLIDSGGSETGASLYLFAKKPPLTGKDHFVIDGKGTGISGFEYTYWSFYLYPGSSYVMDVCIDGSSVSAPVEFYLIKGSSNLNAWSDDPDDSTHTLSHRKVFSSCSSGNVTDSFSISSEGEYFFVLFNDNSQSFVLVNAYLTVDRVKYSVNASASIDNCSISTVDTSCSVPLSLSSKYTALLAVNSPADHDYSKNIKIDVSCNARVWMYVVVVAAPTIFVIAVIIFTTVCCVCVLRRRRRKKEHSSPTIVTGDPLPGNEDAPLVTEEPPPAYNPNYPSGQAGYGYGTQPPPPAYK